CIVDDIDNVVLTTQLADALQVSDLGGRVGYCLQKYHPGVVAPGGSHSTDIGGINKGDVHAEAGEGVEQAVGIAEQECAGDHVVASPQQREKDGADGR